MIHPLVIFYLSMCFSFTGIDDTWKYVLVYLCVFGVTIALSWVSYTYFEKRFLELKEKYTKVKSAGSKNFSERS